MTKETKTNASRLLGKAGIAHRLTAYAVSGESLPATHVAAQLGIDKGVIFKTLVLRGDRNGLFVCVIPGDAEADLRKAAKVSGNKKADLIHVKELLPITGYIRGGCSPVGMKKSYPVFIDSRAAQLPEIYVSAGIRGLLMAIAPGDLAGFLGSGFADLTCDAE